MKLPVTLALKELRHDWQASACFVAALVGVLAPLLIILALKNGVIATLLGRLIEDPSNRELIAIGAASHAPSFFEQMMGREDVAFIMPATRSINAVANGVRNRDARKLERNVTLIPSASADPLSPEVSVAPGSVVLSQSLADDLDVSPGGTIELRIDRRVDSAAQVATRNMRVVGLIPPELYGRSALFISLPDLVTIERFRDDAAITPQTWTDAGPAPESYASFRLYANRLQDIAALETELESRGIATRPRAENVTLLISLRRSLNLLFGVIAVLAAVGFWAAMAANLRGAVERQRVSLSLLALLGLSTAARRAIPAVQSTVLVMGGVVVTLSLILPVLFFINRSFTPEGVDRIARLGAIDLVGTVCLGLVTAITASVWAVYTIGEISPDEVLRAS